ncbi:hypothetical protein ACEWJ6_15980, partial [Escherichia coli]
MEYSGGCGLVVLITENKQAVMCRGLFIELNADIKKPTVKVGFFLCTENPQLGWGFRKAFSFEPVIKTPFDLLKHLAVWQLQVSNKKSKGGPNGGRKEL